MADIQVKFTGDTSDLRQSAADAQRTLDGFGGSTVALKSSIDQLNASMQQASAASEAANTGWRANLQALANLSIILHDTIADVEDFADVMSRVAVIDAHSAWDVQKASFQADADAARGLAAAIGDVARADAQADADVAHGLAATVAAVPSAFAAAGTAITGYAEAAVYGTGASRSFITEQTGIMAALGRTVESFETTMTAARLAETDIARIGLAAIAAAGGLDSFRSESALAGKSASDAFVDFTAELAQIPGMSDDAAAAIEAEFGAVPNYSAQANAFLIRLTRQISATADEAVANAQRIADAFKDTDQGGATLGGIVGALSKLEDLETAATTISHMLEPSQAAAFYATILTKLQAQAAQQKAANDAAAEGLQNQDWLSRVLNASAGEHLETERKKLATLQQEIDALQGQKAVYDQIAAVAARQATFDETLSKANPIDSQLAALQAKRDILQGQLDRNNQLVAAQGSDGKPATPSLSAEDIATLVRTVIGEAGNQPAEGQLATAAVALNRLANGNFGDSLTAILKAGNGSQFNTWLPASKGGSPSDQANAPTPESADQYQQALHNIVMPLVQGKVADPTGGALNFYNPSLTPPQNRFPMTGAQMIGDQLYGTAKNSPAPLSPMDPAQIAQTQQGIEALDAQIKKLNDEKAGGNAIDQASLEIAQEHATATRNELADAQKRVQAAQDEVNDSKNLPELAQNQAAQKLADAQNALRDKQAEADIAASKVQAASMEQGSEAQIAVLNNALAEKLAIYERGSAQYNGVLQEMIANTKRAADAQTAIVKQQSGVAILARTATQGADPVADAQAKLLQAQQGLTRTGQTVGPQGTVVPVDPSQAQAVTKEQLAAQEAYYQAVDGLRTADAAKQHAADALAVAQTKEGSKEQLDAKLKLYQDDIAAAGGDQAKILAIEAQITEAKRAYAKSQAADAAETETAAWDAAERRYTAERAAIEENARLGQVTEAQKAQQVTASLDAQLAAVKAHYAALAQIAQANGTDSPMAQVRLAQQAAVAEDKINAERVASARAANDAIAQSYKSSFEQLGSTVSSTLMQMIQGQAELRDLARAVVLNLIQQFIEARIKIVADWAAGQVAQVAQTVAAEQAKTAATTAGTATRTDIVGMGSLEQSALVGVGIVKSIMASAAETFAGIFGFLSPIMGPAAAGPAAAGQAAVAAVAGAASFDIGSWQLPSTGLAVVHAGEMIVPAAQTPWAQSLMASAGGGGAGGGTQHVHFNVTAMDSGDVRRFFANNSRAILNAIGTGVRNGAHLGLARGWS